MAEKRRPGFNIPLNFYDGPEVDSTVVAVTKRLRFEILRRDNHQCRYCGGALQWDHMTTGPQWPVVLHCERCGRPFQTDVIRALCGACQRAQEVAR